MLTLSFNILTCVYLWIKAMKKLNDNLIKEENFSQCYRNTHAVKKTKIDWQRLEGFCPRENNQFFWQIWYQTSLQIPTLPHLIILTSFFAICNVFFSKTKERKTEASLSHSQCQVFQRLQHHVHWRVNTYSAISFEEINFFTVANLHFDYGKPL